ncbi:MAG: hypothetical protein ABEH66_06990 [Halobacteriales archaeon]
MQRRAAAAYATLFLLLAAGSYLMIGAVQEPAIALDNPDYTVSEGETVTIDGRTYTVGTADKGTDEKIANAVDPAGRETTLVWVNDSEKRTTTIDNGTEVPAVDVSWSGQRARQEATLDNGTTVSFNGSGHTLLVGDGSFTVRRGNATEEFGVGDTFSYRGNGTTIVAAGNGSATLAWGEPYLVITMTASNDSFDFRQSFNVSGRLAGDPAVDNETVTRADGREYVVYANGTTQLLDAYLPEPEVKTFSEGDSFTYNTAEDGIGYEDVTVEDVSEDGVVLSWRAPVEHEVSAAEGDNVTLGPDRRTFVAHFPDNGTLQLSSNLGAYQDERDVQATFRDRVNGLWGVSILSGLAAILLIGLAYLPSRY